MNIFCIFEMSEANALKGDQIEVENIWGYEDFLFQQIVGNLVFPWTVQGTATHYGTTGVKHHDQTGNIKTCTEINAFW